MADTCRNPSCPIHGDVPPHHELDRAIVELARAKAASLAEQLLKTDSPIEAAIAAVTHGAPSGWVFRLKITDLPSSRIAEAVADAVAGDCSEENDIGKRLGNSKLERLLRLSTKILTLESYRPAELTEQRDIMGFLHCLRGRLLAAHDQRQGIKHEDIPIFEKTESYKFWHEAFAEMLNNEEKKIQKLYDELKEQGAETFDEEGFAQLRERALLSFMLNACAAGFDTLRERVKLSREPAEPPPEEEEILEEDVEAPEPGEAVH